jgi:hypothetical protein
MRLLNLRQKVQSALAGEAIPTLSIAGNTFTVISEGNSKVVSYMENDGRICCDVHFVDAAETISKMFWKEKFSQKEDEQVAPTCFSEDGIKPDMQSTEKQCDFCAQCPHNVWGTAIGDQGNGKGKRCRDVWKTAVVVPKFGKEALFQFRVPPGSLKNWKAYMAQFAEFEVGGREGMVGDVITRIWFVPGKQGIVDFEPVQMVQAPQMEYLMLVNNKGLANNLVGLPAHLALPAPEQKMQLEAPKTSVAAVMQKVAEVQEPAKVHEEEDELTQLKKKLAAMEAAKATEKQKVEEHKAPTTEVKKDPVPAAKTSKFAAVGGMTGMRTVDKKTGAVEGAPKVSKFASLGNGKPVQEAEAEIIPPQTKQKPNAPEGIPDTNLPPEIANMLKGIMGV